MEKSNIILKTITPVHIGSGKHYLSNSDYLFFADEKEVIVVDEKKVLSIIGEENIHLWLAIIENGDSLLEYLKTRKNDLSTSDVSYRRILVPAPNEMFNGTLKEQLHLGINLEPSIPGSSLKGAIRTLILREKILSNPYFVENNKNFSSRNGNFFDDKNIQANYFGKADSRGNNHQLRLDAKKDFMRMIRVSDIHFTGNTECRRINIINQYGGDWKHKENETSLIECIPANSEADLIIDSPRPLLNYLKNRHLRSAANIMNNERFYAHKKLFKIINNGTLALLQEELKFWNLEENREATQGYVTTLDALKSQIETIISEDVHNECILKVGAGSGWDFMTGGWARKEDIVEDDTWYDLVDFVRGKEYSTQVSFPKTRKLIVGGIPLGFVKLSLKN